MEDEADAELAQLELRRQELLREREARKLAALFRAGPDGPELKPVEPVLIVKPCQMRKTQEVIEIVRGLGASKGKDMLHIIICDNYRLQAQQLQGRLEPEPGPGEPGQGRDRGGRGACKGRACIHACTHACAPARPSACRVLHACLLTCRW